ncbi:hypothetical protein BO70DRAFT_394180 [Aspergillus heteromorphus CBS 117.55]|uniref:Enoyl reductase (ER) domain-containing protein n=1 Tax=Aspergillus heteromorphus CBS 117.55 TaxID=1448321 RepID=A0A317WPU4_9EURO|nr:uncharacterized protein BO70DRAFT_394180 [Aspergillus heteromorphus CBS 117.55]PWY88476.1 hypothetical protein BO70DRAFT_394180 [Aspergillus heteromorphus CBS 117.55]
MSVTNSREVDVILNSLSGALLRARWNCIAPLGRFVEIGKRYIQLNRQLAMARFERAVSLRAIDLLPLAKHNGNGLAKVLDNVIAMQRDGGLKSKIPINSSISDIQQAFRTMQTGRHTGKLVITAKHDDLVSLLPQPHKFLFSPNRSYLTGGGVGVSNAKWMAQHGAKHIILASRNAECPKHWDFFLHLSNQFHSHGTIIVAQNLDITDSDSLRVLVQGV